MHCSICPRRCRAERTPDKGAGYCRAGTNPVVARCMLHTGEEPCLAGPGGAGAVFFSHCALGCAYCQNAEISRGGHGLAITPERLCEDMRALVAQGADCLDLVTPTHFLPAVRQALQQARVSVPVCWNSGGYERPESLHALRGLIQIYLPDFKHFSPRLSQYFCCAPDYAQRAKEAVTEMLLQTGLPVYNADGRMTRGTLIRHLVLPGCTVDSMQVLSFLSERFPGVPVSLMGQYVPMPGAPKGLQRPLHKDEYARVLDHMLALGIPGYYQALSAADSRYIPAFDLSGV